MPKSSRARNRPQTNATIAPPTIFLPLEPSAAPSPMRSPNGPCFRPVDQLLDVAFAAAGFRLFDLAADQVDVTFLFDVAEDAKGFREVGLAHSAQQEREARRALFVV